MSEMSRQLNQKFDAIVNLRLSQMDGIIRRTPPEAVSYGDEMKEELSLSASIRELSYLGLYTAQGDHETIYGEDVEVFDQAELKTVLESEKNGVTSGFNEAGERLVLFVLNAAYPMSDGRVSTALVAGLPMDYMKEALVLEEENSLVYYHIIRRDGSFVIRSGDGVRDNYFTRIREVFSEYNGRTPEQWARELEEAMDADVDYSAMTMVDGVHHHIYCSHLPGSEWYLVSVMPYGVLDDAINRLGMLRQFTMLGVCGVILVALLIIFALYYRMSQNQMKALDAAEKEAVRANRAKSEFLSNMSHDIRTPMNGIVGMTAIAMANIDDQSRVKDCLTKITLSSKHLLGLINDVLDMSKIGRASCRERV